MTSHESNPLIAAAHVAAAALAPWVTQHGAWLIVDHGLVIRAVWGPSERWEIPDPTVLVGHRLGDVFGESVTQSNERVYREALSGSTVYFTADVGESVFDAVAAPVRGGSGEVMAALVVFMRQGGPQ